MKKALFAFAAMAIALVSCGGGDNSGLAAEEALTATDSATVSLMSSSIPGKICDFIKRGSEKMEVTIYNVGEKDGKLDVYAEFDALLDSVSTTPGFEEDAEPTMEFSVLKDHKFTDIAKLAITPVSKENVIPFITKGTKGDHLKIRYRGTMEKEDFELVKGGERASVNYMGLRIQEAPAAEGEKAE